VEDVERAGAGSFLWTTGGSQPMVTDWASEKNHWPRKSPPGGCCLLFRMCFFWPLTRVRIEIHSLIPSIAGTFVIYLQAIGWYVMVCEKETSCLDAFGSTDINPRLRSPIHLRGRQPLSASGLRSRSWPLSARWRWVEDKGCFSWQSWLKCTREEHGGFPMIFHSYT
jgi:hypothetical protein